MKRIIIFSIIIICFLTIGLALSIGVAKESNVWHPTIITSDNTSSPHRYTQEQPPTSDPPVTISNMQFMPQSLDVTVGSTVTWTNHDSVSHTTTADNMSTAENWDSGVLSPGQSFSKTFNTPGTYTYHCNIHPFMHGTIIVTQNSSTQPAPTITPTVTPVQTVMPTSTNTSTPMRTAYPSTTTSPYLTQNIYPSTTMMPTTTTTTYTTQPQSQTHMHITCSNGSTYTITPNQDISSICPSVSSVTQSQSQSQTQAQSANSTVNSGGFSIQMSQSQMQSQMQGQP